MSSQYQLYQKTMEGFLASLDRLGEQQRDRASTSSKASRRQPVQPPEPAPQMSEGETQLLEEAVADIERIMRKSPEIL